MDVLGLIKRLNKEISGDYSDYMDLYNKLKDDYESYDDNGRFSLEDLVLINMTLMGFYEEVNRFLREDFGSWDDLNPYHLPSQILKDFANELDLTLAKVPRYISENFLYRQEFLWDKGYSSHFIPKIGQVMKVKQFWPTTKNSSVFDISRFAWKIRPLLKNSKAKDISEFEEEHSCDGIIADKENEVLFERNTKFRLIGYNSVDEVFELEELPMNVQEDFCLGTL